MAEQLTARAYGLMIARGPADAAVQLDRISRFLSDLQEKVQPAAASAQSTSMYKQLAAVKEAIGVGHLCLDKNVRSLLAAEDTAAAAIAPVRATRLKLQEARQQLPLVEAMATAAMEAMVSAAAGPIKDSIAALRVSVGSGT
jgi:hypothetical protein